MSARRAALLGVLAPITAVLVIARGCGGDRPARLRPAPMPTAVAPATPPTRVVIEPEGPSTATELARRWPIVARLPHEAPGWRVDFRVEGDSLVLRVRLRALRLRDAAAESYESQLRRYKAEALAWLGPGAWAIEWDPREAATL